MKKIKRVLRLIPIIAYNLGKIFYLWVKEKFVRHKKWSVIISSALLVVILVGGGILGWKQRRDSKNPENQPQVYEALVNVVDEKSGNVEEDKRLLKKNDVIAYFPEGHPWTETERISYLIVKMKLRPDEAAKLTEAETKEVKRDTNGDNEPKDMGPQMETVRARKYTLDLPGYDLQKFWESHQQPFEGKIFGSNIIDKK